MQIVADRRHRKITIGSTQRHLHSKKGSDFQFFCENDLHVQFREIGHLSGAELPDKIRIDTLHDQGNDYKPVYEVAVLRRGNRLRITVICSFLTEEWEGPAHIDHFFENFVRILKGTSGIHVMPFWDDDQNHVVEIERDLPASTRLAAAYETIVRILPSAHDKAMRTSLADALTVSSLNTSSKQKQYDAFMCHDSRDKSRIARPLTRKLSALGCRVWMDERELGIGMSLRERIEQGLRRARKCIVILSPHFLKNKGWTLAEYNAIFTREMVEKRKLFLPVWSRVTQEQVCRYSPVLADRYGVNWSLGVDEVASHLFAAVRARHSK